jgi:hypothetical protein
MENVNESHDKPAIPSTNVETSSPSLQIKLDPTKKKKKSKAGNQSVVWSHYTKVETIEKGNSKAIGS